MGAWDRRVAGLLARALSALLMTAARLLAVLDDRQMHHHDEGDEKR